MKVQAKTATADMKQAYNRELATADAEAVALVPFDEVRQKMVRARAEFYPRNVYLPDQVTAYLELGQSPLSAHYHKTLNIMLDGKRESVVILKYQNLIDLVDQDVTHFLFDATFSTCPQRFYQAFNVAARISGVIAPLFCALMTRKHYEVYLRVLETIRDDFPQIRPRRGKSDFEAGLMNACEAVFPQCKFTGCFFHAKNGMEKMMKRPGKLNN